MGIGEGREGSRRGLGGVTSGFTLAHCWSVSHFSVREGWSRKDRQAHVVLYSANLLDPTV